MTVNGHKYEIIARDETTDGTIVEIVETIRQLRKGVDGLLETKTVIFKHATRW